MSTSERSGPLAQLQAVRAAAERLAQRLRFRSATTATGDCSEAVPLWWREGLAGSAVFGDGLLCLPAREDNAFSRPVALLSAAEISMAAGGEYVPLAWVEGGASIALVRDRGALPVVVVTPDTTGRARSAAEPVADSLAEFLDALIPQTLCRFVGKGTSWSVELCGTSSLLVERDGATERRDFSTTDDIGDYVSEFMIEALEAGMRATFCPARMRPLVASFGDIVPVASPPPPEARAHAAIQHLVADGSLALNRGEVDLEELIDDAGRFIERQGQSTPMALARRFADWLTQHPAVDDLYADDDAVCAALERPAPATVEAQ